MCLISYHVVGAIFLERLFLSAWYEHGACALVVESASSTVR